MSQQQPVTPLANTAPKSARGGKPIAILSLLIALIAVACVFYSWRQAHMDTEQAIKQIVSLQQDTSRVKALLAQQQRALQVTMRDMQGVLAQNQRKESGLALMEVDYLVKMAAFNLTFENNVALAQQLLNAADQRIQASGDAEFWPLRQVFATDLAALNAVPAVDLPGLIARLGALSHLAEQLPQIPVAVIPVESQEKPAPPNRTTATFSQTVQRFLKAAGNALSTMVIITRDEDKFAPSLLTADQRLYIVTNIQSQLTLAQWAAIHRQTAVYQQSLQQIVDWLNRYYAKENPLVQSMLKDMDGLKSIEVNPIVPNIDHSLEAIQTLKGKTS